MDFCCSSPLQLNKPGIWAAAKRHLGDSGRQGTMPATTHLSLGTILNTATF